MTDKLRRWALTGFIVFLIIFMVAIYSLPSLTGF